MKKLIKLCIIFGTIVICIVGFKSGKDFSTPSDSKANITKVECTPEASPDAAAFVAPLNPPPTLLTRKNVYSLTPAEIASIKTGIAAMKALPLTNPTSWQYQAAIHGTTLTNHLPQWNTCQHGTKFFFSWHRMYLYFFERILRAKSSNPNLTLPYWDYQSNASLPLAYRTPTTGNTLYDPTRNSSINNGGALPNGPLTVITNIMTNDTHFFDFNNDLQGPHGSIHVAIGGNMGAVNKAALDPCFWLHHTNIDRLWEKWLRMCGGRANPTNDGPWMNQVFTFYNENGQAINMTGSQIINTASQLNYRYDLPNTPPCNKTFENFIPDWNFKLIELVNIKPHVAEQTSASFKLSFKEAATEKFNKTLLDQKIEKLNFANTGTADRLFVKLDDIQLSKLPEGVIEVYLNLPPGEKPLSQSKYFAGVLDLFSISMDHMGMGSKNSIRVNISNTFKALGLTIKDLNKAELTFVSKGNIIGGNETKTANELKIGSLSLVLEKPSAN